MKKFFFGKLGLGLAVVVLVGAAGGWYYLSHDHQGTTFRTATVDRGDLQATINATGTIEPEEVIDVGAQVAGLIKEFGPDPRDSSRHIDYGTPVEKDWVLAKIDDTLFEAAVEKAKADLAQAEANLKHTHADLIEAQSKLVQTERDWARVQKLAPSKVIADVDADTAQNAYETAKAVVPASEAAVAQAQAGVDTSKALLKQAQINHDYCTIQSPVKGIIIDRRVNVGQTVVSSLSAPSLFLIAKDLKRLQVWASVNEADIGHIHSGQTVHFAVDAFPGEKFTGVVAPDQPRLNATMTQNVVTYTVVVATDNSDGRLKPYMTASLEFEVTKHSNVLLVPNSALRWKPNPDQVVPEARDAFLKALKRQSGAPGDKPAAAAPEKESHDSGRLWVQDRGFVKPIKVHTGLSDGLTTEISGDGLQEGMVVVVGEEHPNTVANTTSNPFTPQLFGGKKQ